MIIPSQRGHSFNYHKWQWTPRKRPRIVTNTIVSGQYTRALDISTYPYRWGWLWHGHDHIISMDYPNLPDGVHIL